MLAKFYVENQRLNSREFELRRIRALVSEHEPRIRDSFLRAIERVRESIALAEIARIIQSNGLTDSTVIELTRAIPQQVATQINIAFTEIAESQAEVIAQVTQRPFAYDSVNQRAVRIIQQKAGALIRGFNNQQVNATREALRAGTTLGLNPRRQALIFRASVGLTSNQSVHVANLREQLSDPSFIRDALRRRLLDNVEDRDLIRQSAISGNRLTISQQNQIAERYRQNYINYRSEVIARTETLRATHEANNEAYRQAIDDGVVQADQIIQTWNTAGNARVRDSHVAMQGQQRDLDVPFISGLGNSLRYPLDPFAPQEDTTQCVCVVTRRIRRARR